MNKHINLSVGCGKSCGGFLHDPKKGKLICDVCGKDFTKEAVKIYEALKIALLKEND